MNGSSTPYGNRLLKPNPTLLSGGRNASQPPDLTQPLPKDLPAGVGGWGVENDENEAHDEAYSRKKTS